MSKHEAVYILDGCRSPIGRGHPEKGMYRNLRAEELAVHTLKALLARNSLDPERIDDFYLGCVDQLMEQGKNLARLIVLLSGLPRTIPGLTINRLCASSLTALQLAADGILGRARCERRAQGKDKPCRRRSAPIRASACSGWQSPSESVEKT